MKRLSAFFLAIMVLGHGDLYSGSLELGPADINDVNDLFALLDTKLTKEDLRFLKAKELSSSLAPPASLLTSVILYKADPKKYEGLIYKAFSIHDYLERSRGNYNLISREEMLSEVQNIEDQYKDKISDGRAPLFLSFCLYRDQNKWILKDGQKISLARFFRSAFLSSALKGVTVDVLGLANKIDKRTELEDLKK